MVVTRRVPLQTQGDAQIVDITRTVAKEIDNSPLTDGVVTIFTPSSTSALTTIEYESGALSDLRELFDRVAPTDIVYRHNERWGDMNGHSHVRAALLGASLTVPVSQKRMTLGTWQQIVFIDFDNRPRRRELVLQLIGE